MKVLSNCAISLGAIIYLLVISVPKSRQDIKILSLGDHKLCSDITNRKVKYDSLLVTEGRDSEHSLPWLIPDICKFEVHSVYSGGGVVAVMQHLNLRRNSTSGDCIDYVQFRTKKGINSPRHCGKLDAKLNMHYDPETISPVNRFQEITNNSFIDVDGEMHVTLYIAKEPLGSAERTDLAILFTSYRDCSVPRHTKYGIVKECDDPVPWEICINQKYFGDGYINCPQFGCLDEGGCVFHVEPEGKVKVSVGHRLIIGSISTLAILFAVFILLIWAFKKHNLLCWAIEFAHPSTTEINRNSRVMEMNEQTGARLAETETNNTPPSAPTLDEEKDLPPSYDSLFPAVVNPK